MNLPSFSKKTKNSIPKNRQPQKFKSLKLIHKGISYHKKIPKIYYVNSIFRPSTNIDIIEYIIDCPTTSRMVIIWHIIYKCRCQYMRDNNKRILEIIIIMCWMRWKKLWIKISRRVEIWNFFFQNVQILPCMAVAFPQPFPHDHDLNYPDLLLLMDLNSILQAAVNCPTIMMLMVQAITPNLIQDLRRTRVETSYSLGIGNHPIMTQQAEVFI